jgi:TrmH family RNA methyltransferase
MIADEIRRLRADSETVTVEGFHALKHALRFGAQIALGVTDDLEGLRLLTAELAPDLEVEFSQAVQGVPSEVLALASPRRPRTGIVAFARRPRIALEEVLKTRSDRPVVLLENPRDLGNLGAVVRVAAAADAAGVLTIGGHDPWEPAALRGSAGLHFALPVIRSERTDTSGRPLVALDPEGEPVSGAGVPSGAILAFGSERRGLTPELLERADARVSIPMREGVSSLNLATAVAVALFTLPFRITGVV